MEEINQNTKSVCIQIKELLIGLEVTNKKIIEENKPPEKTDEVRAAGITTTVLNSDEINWRRHLRGWRNFPHY